jgi:hypothetical protein
MAASQNSPPFFLGGHCLRADRHHAPKIDAPRIDTPCIDAPYIDTPCIDAPYIDTP